MIPPHMKTAANLSPDLKQILDTLVNYHVDRMWHEEDKRSRARLEREDGSTFSLAQAIVAMSHEALVGPQYDFLKECAGLAGFKNFDRQRIFVPWKLMQSVQRGLTVSLAAGGGYLVGTSYGAAADILRGVSVVASAGVTFVDNLQGMLAIPRVTTAPTTHAVHEEVSITESTPALSQVAMTMKSLGCFVEFSRRLLLQANADSFIAMIMRSALGQFLDRQVLQGSGAAGELMGLFNTAGVQTQSGTSLAHSGTTTMKQLAAEAGASDSDIAFVATPAVRQLLENREKATGNGGFVWEGGAVADRPAFASNDCPDASMITGPWPQVIVGQWGPPGIRLELNPYEQTKFQQDIIQARMIIDCDMGIIRPGAFVKSESIT